MYKLTKAQHAKDSEVFGAILSGALSQPKTLKQHLEASETKDGVCALGAGLQGVKETRKTDIWNTGESNALLHNLVPMIRFTTRMGVSENYGCGINDGFENNVSAAVDFYPPVNRMSLDYERGWHVGQAIREAFNL